MRLECPHNQGITQLIANLLLSDSSAENPAEYLENLGISCSIEVDFDYCFLSFKCLTEDITELLIFLGKFFATANFTAQELTKITPIVIDRILPHNQSPVALAYQQLQTLVYGTHPYGYPAFGTIETIKTLTSQDLQTHYDRYFCPSALTMGITANIAPNLLWEIVETAFSAWQSPIGLGAMVNRNADFLTGNIYLPWENDQTSIMVGYPLPSVHNDHFYAAKVLNAHLGNGSSSRLCSELREKRGLVYDVSTQYPTRFDRSHLLIHCTTNTEYREEVKEIIFTETDRLQQKSLSSADLELAKSKLLGNYALAKQTTAQVSQITSWYDTLQLAPDFDYRFDAKIESVTAQEIQEVARLYLSQSAAAIVG